jgi:hypothetical protein
VVIRKKSVGDFIHSFTLETKTKRRVWRVKSKEDEEFLHLHPKEKKLSEGVLATQEVSLTN